MTRICVQKINYAGKYVAFWVAPVRMSHTKKGGVINNNLLIICLCQNVSNILA